MNTPLVSIIIPTFNRAHLIGETLDSIIAQTYTNWECIVVDDGSTDNTNEVMEKYCVKDSRIKYHHRPKNRPKGGNACRNYGFELSKGEYVNWFDDDDLMLPKKLEIQIKELHNSTFDYTICQTMMFSKFLNKEIGLNSLRLKSDNIFQDYITFKLFWLIEAPLWKKNFLKNNNLFFDEKLYQRQDYDFHIRVLNVSQNYSTNNFPLVYVIQHEDRMSNSSIDKPEKLFSNAKVKNDIIKNYKNKLDYQIVYKLYKELLNLYKYSLRIKDFKNSIYIYKCLYDNIIILNLNFKKKNKYLIKLSLSFISFNLFSKGDCLLRTNDL